MSMLDELNKVQNEQAVEDRKVAAQEHLVELERLRLLEEAYKNPSLIAFWARRKTQTQALRDIKVRY
jgi:hypothetical protein